MEREKAERERERLERERLERGRIEKERLERERQEWEHKQRQERIFRASEVDSIAAVNEHFAASLNKFATQQVGRLSPSVGTLKYSSEYNAVGVV